MYSAKISKKRVISVALIILSIVIVYKNVDINHRFPNAAIIEKHMNEDVEISHDLIAKVKEFHIDDIQAYEKTVTENIRQLGGEAKVAIAQIEIDNYSTESRDWMAFECILQNNVWSNGINLDLFYELNPETFDIECRLDGQSRQNINLPFVIYDFQMKEKQWKKLNASQFELVLSFYPERISIKLH